MDASHIGENRKTCRRIVMELKATVTVDWPEGIEFDEEKCKSVAHSASSQMWETDVGQVGKIVWAKAFWECSDDDIEIVENEEV